MDRVGATLMMNQKFSIMNTSCTGPNITTWIVITTPNLLYICMREYLIRRSITIIKPWRQFTSMSRNINTLTIRLCKTMIIFSIGLLIKDVTIIWYQTSQNLKTMARSPRRRTRRKRARTEKDRLMMTMTTTATHHQAARQAPLNLPILRGRRRRKRRRKRSERQSR